jgi:hypothetical protein
MTPLERAEELSKELGLPAEAATVLAEEFGRCWLKGWLVAQAQMVAAGRAYAKVIGDRSFLSIVGPKSAVEGVRSFTDGIQTAEHPEAFL